MDFILIVIRFDTADSLALFKKKNVLLLLSCVMIKRSHGPAVT